MKTQHIHRLLATALIGSVALVGCKKHEEAVTPPPPAITPAPAPAPAPVAATASVTTVDLGSSAGADGKIAEPKTTFAAKDTIIAAVSTQTSDPAASVAGKLHAKWTFQDGQVVNEESRDFNFTGPGVTSFQISKPDGWPVGKYKLEVSLDNTVAKSVDFEVK